MPMVRAANGGTSEAVIVTSSLGSYVNNKYDTMIATVYAANKTPYYSTAVSTTKGTITYAMNSSYAVELISGGGSYSSVKCAIIKNCKGGTITISASAPNNRQVGVLIGIE